MDKAFLENLVGAEAAEAILQAHQQELSALRLEQALNLAVKQAGGRNQKAIRALLDEQAILGAEDMDVAAEAAVAELKRQNGWLFAPPQVSSPGTGAVTVTHTPTMEDVGKMSMAEYKRFRQGR